MTSLKLTARGSEDDDDDDDDDDDEGAGAEPLALTAPSPKMRDIAALYCAIDRSSGKEESEDKQGTTRVASEEEERRSRNIFERRLCMKLLREMAVSLFSSREIEQSSSRKYGTFYED